MPLVDYAASSDEDDSDGDVNEPCPAQKVQPNQGKILPGNLKKEQNEVDDKDDSVFSALPRPSVNPLLLLDDSTLSKLLLNNKAGTLRDNKSDRVKISVPSVSDFKDDKDEPRNKKQKVDVKSSGLFSILPPPKNDGLKVTNKTFVPHSVSHSNINKKTSNNSSIINKYLKKPDVIEPKPAIGTELQEVEDEEVSVEGSFFGSFLTESNSTPVSRNDNVTAISSEQESTPSLQSGETISFNESYQYEQYDGSAGTSNYQISEANSNMVESQYQPESNETGEGDSSLGLDEKALQILCGGKKKRQHMPMSIIDLSGEEIMPDSKEWLLKQFMEEKKGRGQSHRKTNGPSTQQRRKHQITYLAFQAKEQELELQNQWANNRMSRRQTQSKYGF